MDIESFVSWASSMLLCFYTNQFPESLKDGQDQSVSSQNLMEVIESGP